MSVAGWRAGWRRGRLDRPARVALALGVLGVAYRLVLILLGVPASNSDEATFGLAALHIATGRELPVLLYGQRYMGMVESYLAAPLFTVFEPSWLLLRLPLLVLYAVFVYLMYRLTRRLYSPWLAAFTVGLLALGSERVIRDQLTAVGGRPEIKPAVVGLLLLTVWLGNHPGRRRWLAFGGFGLLAGLCVWSDWLALPYLATTALSLLVCCGRELLGRAGPALLGGFLIGVSPLIVANIAAPSGADSLSVLLEVSTGDVAVPSLARRLHGAVLVGIPLASGICPSNCGPWQMSWGPLYLVLLLAAATVAVAGLRRRSDRPRYTAQLALAVAAALTVVGYARSAYPADAPLASARYLSVLQISLPAILWPLWLAARARPLYGFAGLARWRRRVPSRPIVVSKVGLLGTATLGLLGTATLVLLAGAALASSAALVARVGAVRAEERRSRELADAVRAAGIRYVYGGYWTCNRLTFMAREQVVCAVLDDRLQPGQDRYAPYRERVHGAERPAFVFEAGTVADTAIRSYLSDRDIAVTVIEVNGHRIYQPAVTIQPWR